MGSAAKSTSDPSDSCHSHVGIPKQRWPNELAAWYVAELCLLGQHGRASEGVKLYAYECAGCGGWHLATCRNWRDRRLHRHGIEELQKRLRATKSPQQAGKKRGIS